MGLKTIHRENPEISLSTISQSRHCLNIIEVDMEEEKGDRQANGVRV